MLFQDLLNEARKRLAEIAKDPVKYASLLEGLVLQVRPTTPLCKHHRKCVFWGFFSESSLFVFQGFYQLLEPKVTIRCRQQDVELVQVRL